MVALVLTNDARGQVALGVVTVMTLRAVPLAVGHFAGAAALWALWTSAFLMTRRRLPLASSAPAAVPGFAARVSGHAAEVAP